MKPKPMLHTFCGVECNKNIVFLIEKNKQTITNETIRLIYLVFISITNCNSNNFEICYKWLILILSLFYFNFNIWTWTLNISEVWYMCVCMSFLLSSPYIYIVYSTVHVLSLNNISLHNKMEVYQENRREIEIFISFQMISCERKRMGKYIATSTTSRRRKRTNPI